MIMTPGQTAGIVLLALFLTACAEIDLAATVMKSGGQEARGHYKVGQPYEIKGVWYHPAEDPFYDEEGIASWYGEPFHGQLTANGEIYDMNELTAAHKTLPMPVYVRVTNLENGRSLVLRVNDRGPFIAGRIIDVSRRGAQLLGFEGKGTARVRVQAVDQESGRTWAELGRQPVETDGTAAPAIDLIHEDPGGGLFVQAGAFTNAANAFVVSNALIGTGDIHVIRAVVDDRVFYRVRVGPFVARAQADRIREQVMNLGYHDAIVVTAM
ncbi:MAG: septal ring lytic transglycosylase RlpA family protein [Alphaproteobacteria bacterium]|nr:septal ring lytic transglycosylase RlpA family protein [Alphaproteobacteria bacterium]